MSVRHMVLYGHFGVGNVGNDTTLDAMLFNSRKYQPAALITCVCTGPHAIAERFGIQTMPVDITEDRDIRQRTGRIQEKAVRIVSRGVDEIDFWLNRTRWLRTVDQFVVVGTGALDDMAVRPWNMPYDLFKWCRAAKLAGTRIMFVSVGAGPIVHPVSRVLMLSALKAADYRSYRDTASRDYLRGLGFDTTDDHIYPDLAFSLPERLVGMPYSPGESPRTVGLGVIGYYGWRHDEQAGATVYQTYVDKLKQFVKWLLDQGFDIRLLMGDHPTDDRPVNELLEFVCAQGAASWQNRIFAAPIHDVNDLFREIEKTDLVVASRFHNVLCALLAGRPVISIGYHQKNDVLMAEMGLQAYCQHIEHYTVEALKQQFCSLVAELKPASARIQQQSNQNRQLLDVQYRRVLCSEADGVRHND